MGNNDVLVLAEHFSTISILLTEFGFDSITKVEFTCLAVSYYKETDMMKSSKYNHIRSIFSDFLSIVYAKREDLDPINECLLILEKKGFIKIKGDQIMICKPVPKVIDPFFDAKNIRDTIVEIAKMSLASFVEDVITYA